RVDRGRSALRLDFDRRLKIGGLNWRHNHGFEKVQSPTWPPGIESLPGTRRAEKQDMMPAVRRGTRRAKRQDMMPAVRRGTRRAKRRDTTPAVRRGTRRAERRDTTPAVRRGTRRAKRRDMYGG